VVGITNIALAIMSAEELNCNFSILQNVNLTVPWMYEICILMRHCSCIEYVMCL